MGRRRRRYKPVTYDSKETKTVIGLLSILASLTFFIAFFVDSGTANFFTEVRYIFGQFPTLVVGFFFLNLGLALFDYDISTTNRLSLIAQFLLIFLVPAFLTSLHPSKTDAFLVTEQGQAGGWLGYQLTYELLYNKIPLFGNLTWLILGALVLIFTPVALALSVSKIVLYFEVLVRWLGAALKSLFAYREKIQSQVRKLDLADKVVRVGDLARLEPEDREHKGQVARDQHEEPRPHSDVEVAITDKEIGAQGLSTDRLKYPNWQLPPISLLSPYRKSEPKDANVERNTKIIEQTLFSFGIDAEVMKANIGPTVVQYELNIPMGIRVEKVIALSKNLALNLGVDSNAVRIESIPGTAFLGVEVPRVKRELVLIRELVESPLIQEDNSSLNIAVGKDIDGSAVILRLERMPHLLIAGATGSGKSILTNSFIISLLMKKTPDEVRLILVDPKRVELSDYNGIPHLLVPVITNMDKVVNTLQQAVIEMEKRYNTLASVPVRNIEAYNKKLGFAAMPYIIIVIDEMADIMMSTNRVQVETAIVRLAQKARAVGIHLILATQRPSVAIITGIIKANIPARIGMGVASSVDSRVILDSIGAESLASRGDLLYKAPDKNKSMRLQGPLVSQEEVIRVVDFIKSQAPNVEYDMSLLEPPPGTSSTPGVSGEMSDDNLFAEAVRLIVNYQKGSSSFLQRRLNIGFNRAARLIEEMEEVGVVGPQQGSKPREVLVTDAEEFLNSIKRNQQPG